MLADEPHRHLGVRRGCGRLASDPDLRRAAGAGQRLRLRRDLHDGLGPSLSGIALSLEAAQTAVHRDLADTLAERTEEVRQVVSSINGFKAYYLLKIDEGTTTISVFEDRAGAEESNRAAAAWLAENLPDLDVAAPYVTAGEVLIAF